MPSNSRVCCHRNPVGVVIEFRVMPLDSRGLPLDSRGCCHWIPCDAIGFRVMPLDSRGDAIGFRVMPLDSV